MRVAQADHCCNQRPSPLQVYFGPKVESVSAAKIELGCLSPMPRRMALLCSMTGQCFELDTGIFDQH